MVSDLLRFLISTQILKILPKDLDISDLKSSFILPWPTVEYIMEVFEFV